jgi:hypothetical protein
MYDNYKPCPSLQPSEVCFVVEQYNAGNFETVFHTHVPSHRISNDARIHLLKALVVKFGGMSPELVVSSYLNNRAKTPSASEALRIVTSYPEPGVLRCYCGANTKAWSDQVIVASKFRTSGDAGKK